MRGCGASTPASAARTRRPTCWPSRPRRPPTTWVTSRWPSASARARRPSRANRWPITCSTSSPMASCTFWDTIIRPTPRPSRWRPASAPSWRVSASRTPTRRAAPQETMASQGTEDPSHAHEAEKEGPLDAVLGALGLRRKARPGAEAEERSGSELVDQAEAFQTVTVADVMIPRADIVALEIATPLGGVVAQFIETEHSRLPIYRETLDDPVGFVHIKDVFKLVAGKVRRPAMNEAVLGRLRRESLYVPPSMRAADLLVRMQASRIHLAMVIDEFGGVDGLVTLENVIEAVVGEIDDEHDVADAAQIVARAGGVFEVDARADLDEIRAAVG